LIIYQLYDQLKQYAELGFTAIRNIKEDISYTQLIEQINMYRNILSEKYPEAKTIILYGDYDLRSISILWASLMDNRIIMPITSTLTQSLELVNLIDADLEIYSKEMKYCYHPNNKKKIIIREMLDINQSGLILLSSGTTGIPKAVLHDSDKLLKKYIYSKKRYTTIGLMLFDHIAGIDTLFYVLSSGGSLIIPQEKSIDNILTTMSQLLVEVLPASPSLIQFLLMDDRFNSNYLPSLKVITIGSERINDNLNSRLKERFGGKVELIQKYGITEIGTPATITRDNDPRYIKFKSGLIDYKIDDNVLYIKSPSSMVGYLSPDQSIPFDGWFNTQDQVEVDGEWIKILGRVSDIINVGGQKVYPAEVESVLQSMDNVINVAVYGKSNLIMGSVVAAKVCLDSNETALEFKKRMREFCKDKLQTYKIPSIVEIVDEVKISDRYKKVRG
jgi:acyl-CoA synthetase (AMP-forming)/AMP-acid ligase II